MPHGAVRCGAVERETEAERSAHYDEGEHQPAKTEMKAQGRTKPRIAGQDRGVRGKIKRDRRTTLVAGRRDP